MTGWLLSRLVPWRMRAIRYPEQGEPAAAELTREVVDSFLLAAEAGFRGEPAEALLGLEAGLPWSRRPFFWEGQAFGAAGRLACTFADGGPAERYHAPGFRFMLYTGVGVWNGVASAYHLPAVPVGGRVWEGVPDHAACAPLIAGGAAFARVMLAGRVSRPALEGVLKQGGTVWRRGAWQGAGRAAWFLYMRDPGRLAALLDGLEDVGEPLAEGLGLAITFTQLAEPERVLQQLEALPARWGRALRAGARTCLGATLVDDPRCAPELSRLPPPLSAWAEEGRAALAAAGPGPDMIERLVTQLHALP